VSLEGSADSQVARRHGGSSAASPFHAGRPGVVATTETPRLDLSGRGRGAPLTGTSVGSPAANHHLVGRPGPPVQSCQTFAR
jgi:hypothetical protein